MEAHNEHVRKSAFILILILLFIFLPLTCGSVYLKVIGYDKPKALENTLKEFKFDNKLWFYNKNGELLDTYVCEFPDDYCGYAKDYNLDSQYSIQSVSSDTPLEIPLINERYVFIIDSSDATTQPVFLIDTLAKTSYKTVPYQHLKNYGVGLANNMIIVQNSSNLYGVMQLTDSPNFIIPFKYSYIAVQNDLDENNLLKTDKFIVNFDGSWYLINNKDEILTSSSIDPIVAYNNDSIITKDYNNFYHFLDYEGNDRLEYIDYLLISFVGENNIAITTNDEFYVYNYKTNVDISRRYPIDSDVVYSAKLVNDSIQVLRNDILVDNYNL